MIRSLWVLVGEIPISTFDLLTPITRRTIMAHIILDNKPDMKVTNMSNVTLVRTFSAGVHFGVLEKHKGKEVILTNARRLWRWEGACSLNQVAMEGVDLTGSKISMTVPTIILTEAIELIPMSRKAAKMMTEAKPWKIEK